MSFIRTFHGAVGELVALEAHGALDYLLEEGQSADAGARHEQIQDKFIIVTIRADGVFLDVNQRACDWVGRNRDDIIGRHLSEIVPQAVADRRMRLIQLAVRTGKAVQLTDSNRGLCLETLFLPVRGVNGEWDRAVGIARPCGVDRLGEREPRWTKEISAEFLA